jgi:hypothetical protein
MAYVRLRCSECGAHQELNLSGTESVAGFLCVNIDKGCTSTDLILEEFQEMGNRVVAKMLLSLTDRIESLERRAWREDGNPGPQAS